MNERLDLDIPPQVELFQTVNQFGKGAKEYRISRRRIRLVSQGHF